MVGGQDRRQPRPRRPGRGRAPRVGLARDHDLGVRVEHGEVAGVAGGAAEGVGAVRMDGSDTRTRDLRYDSTVSGIA